MPTIAFFEKPFQYGVATAFGRELQRALAQLGYAIRTIDVGGADLAAQYQALTVEPVALAIGFNGAGYNADAAPGVNFFDAHAIPYLWIAIDHPAYMGAIFNNSSLLASVVDRTHLRYRERRTGATGRTFFLPHGGSLAAAAERPAAGRRYPILFAGGGAGPAAIVAQWQRQHHASLVGLLREMGEFVAAHSGAVLEDVLGEGIDAAGLPRQDPQHLPYLNAILPSVDGYVRRRRRLRLLRALDEAGIAVDLIGPDWEQHGFRHHRPHPPRSYGEVLAAMAASEIVLNIGPNFPAGSHERVLSGMANGAAVVSDETAYFNETFRSGEELISFRWQGLDEGIEGLRRLLVDADTRHTVAAAGRQAVLQGHLWSHRAGALLQRVQPFIAAR